MVEVIGKTIGLLNEVEELDDNFMFLGCLGTDTSYSTWKTTYGALKEDLSSIFMNNLCSDIENRLNRIENNINNGNSFACNNNTKVATNLDIINAINSFRLEILPCYKLIMDINYLPYHLNKVAISPYFKHKSYVYDSTSTEPNTFYRYAGIKTLYDGTNESARSDGIVFKNISNKYIGIPLTESYKNFKTLTIYTSTEPANTSANEAERIYAINISVNDLNVARLYKDYKALYKHKTSGKCYFESTSDRFYLGDAYDGEIYLNLKVSATFTDTFIPIMTKLNNMIIIGVFGNN